MSNRFDAILLVSAPWPLFNRPSIQIAALKSYLQSCYPDLSVTADHMYLRIAEAIGYSRYHAISQRTWLAEAVYAAILFPDRFDRIQRLFYQQAGNRSGLNRVDFKTLTAQVAAASERWIARTPWRSFGLIGFSICHCQLCASLYFIRKIKSIVPSLPVVIGGSGFDGNAYGRLMKRFSEIDFAVCGEGELPLSRLAARLRQSGDGKPGTPIPGVISADDPPGQQTINFDQLRDLGQLPPPDFTEYFELLGTFAPRSRFFAVLPVEMSRGCWWKRTPAGGGLSGCAFCNLNLQWTGYRQKPARQIVAQIDTLTSAHRALSVAFVDNLIPLKTGRRVFNGLQNLGKDLRLFGEIRANTPKSTLIQMKRAGVVEVQIGIEALSTALLGKMHKGTTAIRNLQIMKDCEELQLVNASNLILQFPGSDSADAHQTLANIEFAMIFRPVRCVDFYLGRGSPVWRHPRKFGLTAVYNHPRWSVLFPRRITRSVPFMLQAYRGDLLRQRRLWKPVREKVKQWQQFYAALHQKSMSGPILSYRDGGDFMIIRQRRSDAEPINHRLVGLSRRIYLDCGRIRRFDTLARRYPQLSPRALQRFLDDMIRKRLMFGENDRYLSLAVPIRPGLLA